MSRMVQPRPDGKVELDLSRLLHTSMPVYIEYRKRRWQLTEVPSAFYGLVVGVEVTRLEEVEPKGDVL